jgi:hypothetical protein
LATRIQKKSLDFSPDETRTFEKGKIELVNLGNVTIGLPRSTAAVYVLNNLRDYNKKGQLKHELSELNFQKYAINEFCSNHSQAIMALMNLHSHGITEDQIISLNNLLESNGYKTSSYTSTK